MEKPLIRSGLGPICNLIISFWPSFVPSHASTKMLTISKHFVGQVLVDDPPQGCANKEKLRQVVNKNNKYNLFIKELIFSKGFAN
jgi:hypothetical protein